MNVQVWHWHLQEDAALHHIARPGPRREFPPVESFKNHPTSDTLCHRLITECAKAIVAGQHPRCDMTEIAMIRLRERETA